MGVVGTKTVHNLFNVIYHTNGVCKFTGNGFVKKELASDNKDLIADWAITEKKQRGG